LCFGVPAKVAAITTTLATLFGIKTPANQAVEMLRLDVGCDGVNAASAPSIFELGTCTFATNSPGTNSTSVTPAAWDSGRPETIQSTAGKIWTAEPTVITIIDTGYVPTYMGSVFGAFPITPSKPIIAKGGNGLVVRATAGANCNASGALAAVE
jgi:hypothetical protein